MLNVGKIPPHYLNFLKDEEIEITNFESSNLKYKDEYDKIIVHFPYCNSFIQIQVIFDNLNNTSPPDFIVIDRSTFYINYNQIIKNFSFRNSCSLYFSLYKIKYAYSLQQEKRLEKIIQNVRDSRSNPDKFRTGEIGNKLELFDSIETILFYIKTEVNNYKVISKYLLNVDIYIDYREDTYAHFIVMSYPLDIYIRAKHIKRVPLINVCIPLDNLEMKFWMELNLPNYFGRDSLNLLHEREEISNFQTYIKGFESYIIKEIKRFNFRQQMIENIIQMGFGFPLEIDTRNFRRCSILFYYKTEDRKKIVNFILNFIFENDEKGIFEFQVLDTLVLEILIRRKYEYFQNENEQIAKMNLNIASSLKSCINKGINEK